MKNFNAQAAPSLEQLDQQLIELIGARFQYVIEVTRFKTDEQDVRDPERVRHNLQNRRQWAGEADLSPDFVERLFVCVHNYFIDEQLKFLRRYRVLSKLLTRKKVSYGLPWISVICLRMAHSQ